MMQFLTKLFYLWLVCLDSYLVYLMQRHLVSNNFSERVVLLVEPLTCAKRNETIDYPHTQPMWLLHKFTNEFLIRILLLVVEGRMKSIIILQLRSSRIRTWVSHAENAWFVMSNLIVELIFEFPTKDRLTASACSSWIPALHLHEQRRTHRD